MRPRLLRITTTPISLNLLLEGQFTYFQSLGYDVLTVSANGQEVQHLNDKRISHRVVPMSRKITPLRDAYCIFLLIIIILKFKPDIVHTHTPKAGLLGMIAGWICRVRVRMHTVAGLPLMEAIGIKASVLRLTERITYACAHRVYPNSIGLLKYIQGELHLGVMPSSASKFSIIGRGSSNGIDTAYFSSTLELKKQADAIRRRLSIPERELVFCFVGRIVTHKGIVELSDAFQRIAAELPCRLLVLGSFEPDLDPLPSRTLTYLNSSERVVLAGFQQDVRPWIAASNIFVFPSYREGFPNAVMQAACLEIPCIVSDINGSNELIQDQETGLVVPSKDVESLYSAMSMLGKDEAKQVFFGKQSREFVTRNFDRKYYWGALQDEYKHLLSSR